MSDRAVKASIKGIKVSHKKLKLVANLINNMRVSEAVKQLNFCRKRAAHDVKKCLISAMANAENNFGRDIDFLYVSKITVGKHMALKRLLPRAKGRSNTIVKKFSSVFIELSEREAK